MNIHKSQLFWCELQGTRFWHTAIWLNHRTCFFLCMFGPTAVSWVAACFFSLLGARFAPSKNVWLPSFHDWLLQRQHHATFCLHRKLKKNCENSLRCEFVEERVQEKRRIREDAADAADAAAAADAADAEWEGMPEISLWCFAHGAAAHRDPDSTQAPLWGRNCHLLSLWRDWRYQKSSSYWIWVWINTY